MFDYIHIIIFAFGLLLGLWKVASIYALMDPVYPSGQKEYSLEKIVLLAIISIFWIFYGVYKNINENFIILEAFAFSALLIFFIVKINSSNSVLFFGKKIPGHGKPENRSQKIIKYLLLVFLIFVPFIIYYVINNFGCNWCNWGQV